MKIPDPGYLIPDTSKNNANTSLSCGYQIPV